MSLACADEQQNLLTNGAFENGLEGWTKQGVVTVATATDSVSRNCAKFGPSAGVLRQTCRIGALRIVYFGASLYSSSPEVAAGVRVQCYDSHHVLVMEQRQELDSKQAAVGPVKTGVYFKTHAFTAYIVVSIEKVKEKEKAKEHEKESSADAYLEAESADLEVFDAGTVRHRPVCDLDKYMEPLWNTPTVYDEMVLLFSEHGDLAKGMLMYTPERILAVRCPGSNVKFTPSRDYTVDSRTITCTPASRLPFMRDSQFENGDLKWYSLAGKQVLVTYTHKDSWSGPVPLAGGSLSQTKSRLKRNLPLTIAATGDSITLGIGTSGFEGRQPYMPTWADLFVYGTSRMFHNRRIRLYNAALGGMTSDWGRETARSAVASLKPDLVLIAFGMNDFWWMPVEHYRENILAIINTVWSVNPSAEFILIAPPRFDPAYAADPLYRARMASYTQALKAFAGRGIAVLDMDAVSGALGVAKKPRDVISDPLHPNDFLARWFAQGLVAAMTQP